MFRETIEPIPSAEPHRTTIAHSAAPPATTPVSQSGQPVREHETGQLQEHLIGLCALELVGQQ